MAKSLISHQAQFFERIAIRAPGSKPCCCRKVAMRRTSSATSFQVNSLSRLPPIGWVKATESGATRSQWYRRSSARLEDGGGEDMDGQAARRHAARSDGGLARLARAVPRDQGENPRDSRHAAGAATSLACRVSRAPSLRQ